MNAAAWSAIAALAGAVLMYLGTRYTAKASRDASEFGAAVAASEGIATGYSKLTRDLWDSIRELRERIEHLEEEMTATNKRYHSALAYIRVLLHYIGMHMPNAEPPPPPPPDDLTDHL